MASLIDSTNVELLEGNMAKPDLADYIDVPDRIKAFKKAYPDGSLQAVGRPEVLTIGTQNFIVFQAMAFRTPDDQRPGVGTAYEPVPGTTPYTRNSELQNAETAAWGRAIVAAMLEPANGKIASMEEVRNRAAEGEGVASDAPSPQLQPDEVEALVADVKATGIDSKSVGLWLASQGVKPARVPEGLKFLSPAQALELKAWAKGELESKLGLEEAEELRQDLKASAA